MPVDANQAGCYVPPEKRPNGDEGEDGGSSPSCSSPRGSCGWSREAERSRTSSGLLHQHGHRRGGTDRSGTDGRQGGAVTGGWAGLPRPARAVVAAWAVAGLVSLAVAAHRLWATGWPGATATLLAAVLGALMAASRVWPMRLSIGGQSETFDLDEGFLVLLLLLVPGAVTVLVFAVVAIGVEAVKRRALLESAFDAGRVVASTGIAAVVCVLLHGSDRPVGYAQVGAALVGVLCFMVLSAGAVVSLLSVVGPPWRQAVRRGLEGRLLIAGAAVAAAIPTALLLSTRPEFLPLALLPLLLLRALGEGQLSARHDRRLRGLFEATLDVHRSIGSDETRAAVLNSAGSLLRSSKVTLGSEQPRGEDSSLAAPLELTDRRLWLSVSGRSRTEPFDDADRALLDALASVGAVALANADLYAAVERQKDDLSVITRSLGEGVCAINQGGEITFMNPAGAGMLGWADLVGADGRPSQAVETPRFLLDPALRAMSLRRNVISDDTRFERADGSHFPVTITASPVVGDAEPTAAVIVFRDTSERKAFEEQLARHAFQDPLTGLANRRLLLDHLDHALLQADRTDARVAVLFGDVDRFKVVNDNLGHQVGDELLRVVADRLRRAVRPGDTLSRFGGDEFVIILEGVASPDDASQVADRVLAALHEPVILSGGHEITATMSIGMALSEEGTSRDDLLPRCRRRHVPRQATRPQRPGDAVRRRATPGGRSSPRTARSRCGPPPRRRAQRGRGVLPADRLAGRPADRRRRGARPLGSSRSRDPLPGAVHGTGRGQRHDPDDRPGRPRAGVPGREGVVRLVRAAPGRQREPLGAPVPAAGAPRAGRAGAARDGDRALPTLPRDQRESGHGGRRADLGRPDRAARSRRPARHRRFRDRPLVPRLPRPVPDRRDQDRPELRARHQRGSGEVRHRLRRGGALPGDRLDDGRRRCRDPARARAAAEPGLRPGAGLLLLAAAPAPRVRRPAPRCPDAPGGRGVGQRDMLHL